MYIRLKNFRCYEDKIFDFGEKGLALLSGPSGYGKTSILMGIQFALYGVGNKIISYGKSSCVVEFEFDDIKIIRSRRPNRLVLNDIYEDGSAQKIINKRFGENFESVSYISQNALNSFIMMSSTDKLIFLEKFAFGDVELGNMKGRCKSYIQKKHDEHVSILSKLEMTKGIVENLEVPKEFEFPLKIGKNSNKEKIIKNENVRYKNCIILCKRKDKEYNLLYEKLNELKVLEATIISRKEEEEKIKDKLNKIKNEKDKYDYEGDIKVEEYKTQLRYLKSERKLISEEEKLSNMKIKLNEMYNEELNILEEENVKLENNLWKEYSKEELIVSKKELSDYVKDLEKIANLRKDLKRYEVVDDLEIKKKELVDNVKELELCKSLYNKLLISKKMYKCPSCSVSLKFDDNSLCLSSEYIDDSVCNNVDLNELKDKINVYESLVRKGERYVFDEENKLEYYNNIKKDLDDILCCYEELSDVDEVKDDLVGLCDYERKQLLNEEKLEKNKNKILLGNFSSSYLKYKKDVEKLEEEVVDMRYKCSVSVDFDITEEELNNKIWEQNRIKKCLEDLVVEEENYGRELCKCQNIIKNARIKYREKYGDDEYDIKKLEEELAEVEKKRFELMNDKNIHEKNVLLVEEWLKNEKELLNYKEWKDKVVNLEKDERTVRSEYVGATMLKEKILEAESISMLNIIETINTHARLYLDYFFPDNPICVCLQPFKETKKTTKPQINVQIEYKGMEADLSMLSGGELSRVVLAYTLALAEMFNSPLLLLDECTSNLDEETTNVVFDCIKENFNGKMTLIIAHQVITGSFDKIINLK